MARSKAFKAKDRRFIPRLAPLILSKSMREAVFEVYHEVYSEENIMQKPVQIFEEIQGVCEIPKLQTRVGIIVLAFLF